MNKLNHQEIWAPNWRTNIKTILSKNYQNLNEKERDFIERVEGLEGGFALQFLWYDSAKRDFLKDDKIMAKFLDPNSYQGWPVFTEEEIKGLSRLEVNVKLSGVLYLVKRIFMWDYKLK